MGNTIIAVLLAMGANGGVPAESTQPNPEERLALMCFKSGEVISGMNKICFYDCLGSTVAITISSVSLCPLTINR